MQRLKTQWWLALCLVLVFATQAFAGVTVVDTPAGNDNVTASLTWNHTATGNAVLVCVVWSNPATTLNDITYNGVSFLSNNLWSVGQAGVVKSAAFLMFNPPSGSQAIVVTMSASVSVGGASVGLSGLDTSSLANSHRTIYTQAAAAQPNITVADSQNGDVVADCTANFSTATLTAGSGQTSEWDLQSFGGSSTRSGGFSTITTTGANQAMTWTGAAGATGGGATALVASSGVTCRGALLLLGVGGC